jgi:AcrR family transcriptional regulator
MATTAPVQAARSSANIVADAPAIATLSTEDWIVGAREMLIAEGIGALKIDRLAKACNVTRGGFYWRFRNRDDLLDQLLDHWRHTNGAAFLAAVNAEGTPHQRYHNLIRLWLDEVDFSPRFDSAIRAWGAVSDKVSKVVRDADDQRIAALVRLFEDAGCPSAEALIRARIVYFHQIGYYALDLRESRETRLEYLPVYYKVLTGFDDSLSPL